MGAPGGIQHVLRHNQVRRIDTATLAGLAKTLQTTAVDRLEKVTGKEIERRILKVVDELMVEVQAEAVQL